MKKLCFALACIASPVAADIEAGEQAFAKQCVACHVVIDDAGQKLAGRSAKTGPNLFGTTGNAAGAVNGYRYSKALASAGADSDLIWTKENFVAWMQDPTGFLKSFTGDSKARSKMSFKIRKTQDAENIFDYLESIAQ